ncbi:hypothetical protein QL285_072935 [Trifolium repens]|nr:hypothetical protein QL285_072935 [Trifolium repens]
MVLVINHILIYGLVWCDFKPLHTPSFNNATTIVLHIYISIFNLHLLARFNPFHHQSPSSLTKSIWTSYIPVHIVFLIRNKLLPLHYSL